MLFNEYIDIVYGNINMLMIVLLKNSYENDKVYLIDDIKFNINLNLIYFY